MQRLFVPLEQIDKDTVTITGSDVNYLKNVLRLKPGDQIEVFDSNGNTYLASILETERHSDILCRITQKTKHDVEPTVRITLAQCLPKGKKMDFIIQKSTELGVSAIIPVISERSIPKIEDKADKKISHWQKVAKEASEQSGRSKIPIIFPLTRFENLIREAKNYDLALIPWENERKTSLKNWLTDKQTNLSTILVIIGPEGGFSRHEIESAVKSGIKPISLGKTILRTETAGIVILAQALHSLEL